MFFKRLKPPQKEQIYGAEAQAGSSSDEELVPFVTAPSGASPSGRTAPPARLAEGRDPGAETCGSFVTAFLLMGANSSWVSVKFIEV